MAFRISELARRSGFRASTLRYYETVGLLPGPDRTGSGYRSYDEGALGRLAFIARAKALGLGLADIADLIGLWADGRCAPVQDRLRELLDRRAGEVREQLSVLTDLAAQLDQLTTSLASTPPSEPCGAGCGCDVERLASNAVPIACTLSPEQAADRSTAWFELIAHATGRTATATGVRLRLPAAPDIVARAGELAVREAGCCAFFSFAITVEATGVWLEVTAPAAGRAMLDALFGAPGRRP